MEKNILNLIIFCFLFNNENKYNFLNIRQNKLKNQVFIMCVDAVIKF